MFRQEQQQQQQQQQQQSFNNNLCHCGRTKAEHGESDLSPQRLLHTEFLKSQINQSINPSISLLLELS